MDAINKLLNLANRNNISISYQDIDRIANGICIFEENSYSIILNKSLVDNPIKHKEILAEEIGHCFTMIDDPTPMKSNTYSRKCRVAKEEEKAYRWASNYLIPTDDLINYLSFIIDATVHEIMEYFEVSRELLMKKLYMMSLEKGYWKIIDEIYLCLDQYPSIYYAQFYDDKFVKIIDEYFE